MDRRHVPRESSSLRAGMITETAGGVVAVGVEDIGEMDGALSGERARGGLGVEVSLSSSLSHKVQARLMDVWFKLVHLGAMVNTKRKRGPSRKRLTITLDARDYDELVALKERRKPPLSLQYVINYAIQRLLRDAKNPQLVLKIGDPLDG